MIEAADDQKGGGRIARAIASHKKSTFGIILVLLVSLASGFNALRDAGSSVSSFVAAVSDPFRDQEAAINALALEQTIEYVNNTLGQPQESEDYCLDMSPLCGQDVSRDLRLNIYRSDQYTVRAVFEANSLKFFAVTLESDRFKPQIRWLDYNLGSLGEVTYKQAYDPVASGAEPTAVMITRAHNSASYAEVMAVGAPGQYQGLVLASAPDGFGELAWNMEGAVALEEAQDALDGQLPELDAAESFRANSVPNTFGKFRDDGGFVGNLLHDPQKVIHTLYRGTNF